MKKTLRSLLLSTLIVGLIVILAQSCASIGTPSGGPRDEDPPRFLYSTPEMGSTDFNGKKAVLVFNELINVKDAFNNVVLSPPGAHAPRVSGLGKRITVEFNDTLLPNTTYTVAFGNSIVDNNEGNALENFLYTFSTGEVLDSLMVSGMVLGAFDLEPQEGLLVGLHSNLADSAFTKTRFERVAKTDEKGRFVIGGLAPGSYRVYALKDNDNDMKYSSPEENIAFYDAVVTPISERITVTDTILNLKTGAVDTVVDRERTRFLPNNILLRVYNSGFKQQYISKYERPDSSRINLIFNAKSETLPGFTLLDTEGRELASYRDLPGEKYVVEQSATHDTVTLWLKNRDLLAADTLRLAVDYYRADSLFNPVAVSDTLRLLKPLVRAPKKVDSKSGKGKKRKETDTIPEPEPTVAFKILTPKIEKPEKIVFEAESPLQSLDRESIRLELKVDTVWESLSEFSVEQDTLNPRRYRVSYPWDFETEYKFSIDSLAGESIYGLKTAPLRQNFKIRPENEYGTLKLNVLGLPDSVATFVQLLDSGDRVKASLPTSGGSVTFPYLLAGKYFARVVIDLNGNGEMDPGNFELGQQPDVVYYFPQPIELKQNWDQELDWQVFDTPVDLMKPEELRKNKTQSRRR